MIFNERLSELRKETNLNQKDFANSLDLEPSKYNKWENGKTVPDFDTVIQLARHLDVTVDYLIGNSDVRKWENADICEKTGLDELSIINLTLLKEFDEVFINDKYFYLENDKTLHFKPSLILNSFISNSSFTSFLSDFLFFIGSHVLLVEYSKWAKELILDLVKNDDAITKSFLGGYVGGKLSNEVLNIAVENLYNIIDRELFEDQCKLNDIDYLTYKFDKEVKQATDDVYLELSEKAKKTLWVSSDLDNLKTAFKEKLDNIAKTIREEQQKENV